jgi:hypothetical protein
MTSYANEEWAKLRRPGAVEFVQKRLSALSKSLGDKPYLDWRMNVTAGNPRSEMFILVSAAGRLPTLSPGAATTGLC